MHNKVATSQDVGKGDINSVQPKSLPFITFLSDLSFYKTISNE